MRTILVRLPAAKLATEMAEMREWLDEHKYEPAKFMCDRSGDLLVLRADFDNDAGADAFERRFGIAKGQPQTGERRLARG